jgi:hypothetical protein
MAKKSKDNIIRDKAICDGLRYWWAYYRDAEKHARAKRLYFERKIKELEGK